MIDKGYRLCPTINILSQVIHFLFWKLSIDLFIYRWHHLLSLDLSHYFILFYQKDNYEILYIYRLKFIKYSHKYK